MTHRIEVNCETGITTQIEYTAEEQVVYDAAVAQQAAEAQAAEAAAEAARLAAQQQAQPPAEQGVQT
jgi:hypothetical protein